VAEEFILELLNKAKFTVTKSLTSVSEKMTTFSYKKLDLKKVRDCWVMERSTRNSFPRPTSSSPTSRSRFSPHSHLKGIVE
jgi:hypothetical protein